MSDVPKYVTETRGSSWSGSLGPGGLQGYLNSKSEEGWVLVSAVQVLEGHDLRGEVGFIWQVPNDVQLCETCYWVLDDPGNPRTASDSTPHCLKCRTSPKGTE